MGPCSEPLKYQLLIYTVAGPRQRVCSLLAAACHRAFKFQVSSLITSFTSVPVHITVLCCRLQSSARRGCRTACKYFRLNKSKPKHLGDVSTAETQSLLLSGGHRPVHVQFSDEARKHTLGRFRGLHDIGHRYSMRDGPSVFANCGGLGGRVPLQRELQVNGGHGCIVEPWRSWLVHTTRNCVLGVRLTVAEVKEQQPLQHAHRIGKESDCCNGIS